MTISPDLLKDKKILLGVTGSIAVYKSLELVRLFVKAGAQVRVIMSESAKKFVTPLSFETLTSNAVLDDTNESWMSEHNHIKSGEWADIFVVAPATANTMAKLAHGVADTMLTQSLLAYTGGKILAPSANTNMLYNPITQKNIVTLIESGYTILGTQVKELACKTRGDGAMAEPLEIFYATARALLKESFWSDRGVIISGGGTIEKIDDVRYLSNFSSGKMASALATALYLRGANVTLVASRHESDIPNAIQIEKVQSSQEMQKSLQQALYSAKEQTKKTPYLFMAAAVSDYTPADLHSGKLKKEQLGENFTLQMNKNRDILASLDKKECIAIGFKAEMDALNAMQNATNMLHKKGLDGVCLNILENDKSFGTDTNAIEFIAHDGVKTIPSASKLSVAFSIAAHAQKIENSQE